MLKTQEEFVHMAVHELKTPVTVLKAYTQLMETALTKETTDSSLAENQLTLVKKMEVQLNKLLSLITDLSDAASINSDSLNCLMNNFSINSCIEECVESISTANPTCQFQMELDPANPTVRGDAERIDQVLNNLVTNAIKYSGEHKHIRISSFSENGNIKVSVSDDGIGIPFEAQDHVFERFYRVEGDTKTVTSGFGLGLFIAAEIIKKHKGQIGLRSEPGNGSVFWFSLPVVAVR
jgi:signal transduction histidine kinase